MYTRTTSKHQVHVLDLNKSESIAKLWKAEQEKDPTVVKLNPDCGTKLGLIKTNAGTFLLDAEGCGNSVPVNTLLGLSIYVSRNREGSFEIIPFTSVLLNFEELQACETKEVVTLDKFVGAGRRLESNYNDWEDFLQTV